MSTTSSELASIEAQLALQRSALADKIFARFDQSTSSSSSKKGAAAAPNLSTSTSTRKQKKQDGQGGATNVTATGGSAPFQHRPPTLGLGATSQKTDTQGSSGVNGQTQGVSRHLSNEDARLRGRLMTGKQAGASFAKRKAVSEAEDQDGNDDDEEDESKAVRLAGKTGKTKADPFAVKSAKASRKEKSSPDAAEIPTATPVVSRLASPPLSLSLSDGRLHTPPLGDETKLSKNQRKKLNKRRRLEQETQGGHGTGDTSLLADTGSALEGTNGTAVGTEIEPIEASIDLAESRDSPTSSKPSFFPSATLPASSLQPASTLSLHQRALHSKIQGSQFRQLNESLYTSQSSESFRLAQEDPFRMQAYHEGFREQIKKWPQKPYEQIGDIIVGEMIAHWQQLLSIGTTPAKGSKIAFGGGGRVSIPPGALIADLGAGEGPLTKYLSSHPKLVASKGGLPASLMPRVLAYDLLDTADGVVRGVDCAQSGGVSLPGRSGGGIRERISRLEQQQQREKQNGSDDLAADQGRVDVVVFCLSLMGLDWVGMILEARRILKNGGQILIAEVSSRFVDSDTKHFTKLIQRLGFKLVGREVGRAEEQKENSHFILLRYAKLLDVELLANAGKVKDKKRAPDALFNPSSQRSPTEDNSSEDSEGGETLICEARELDAKEEERLRIEGQTILKPCLYKRR